MIKEPTYLHDPYLSMVDAAKAIEFLQKIFGAKEVFRLALPDSGKVCHAELTLNGSRIMLGEEHPGMSKSPATLGGTPVRICLMVDDVDAIVDRAQKAGATVVMSPKIVSTATGAERSAIRLDTSGCLTMKSKKWSTQKCSAASMK